MLCNASFYDTRTNIYFALISNENCVMFNRILLLLAYNLHMYRVGWLWDDIMSMTMSVCNVRLSVFGNHRTTESILPKQWKTNYNANKDFPKME